MTVSAVAVLGGVLAGCGVGGEQADCAASEGFVGCVDPRPLEDSDDVVEIENPEVEFVDADEIVVGTRIEVADEAELVVLDGPANAFREAPEAGIYVAAVPGTYQVVEHVRVPCGGPPDERDARTITIVGDSDDDRDGGGPDDGAAGPAGLLGAARALAPSC